MCAEALSQEEIDALLRGEPPPEKPSTITPEEEDTLRAFNEMVVTQGGEVLSTLLGETLTMEAGEYKETDPDEVTTEIEGDMVVAELNYKGLLQGKALMIMAVDTALSLASKMTGGGTENEFGDLEESALSEAIQSHFSSINTQIAQKTEGDINLESPDITTKPGDITELLPESPERLIMQTYTLQVGDTSGTSYLILPRNLLHSIAGALSGEAPGEEKTTSETRDYGVSSAPAVMETPAQFAPSSGGGMPAHGGRRGSEIPGVDTTNLELILDIQVDIRVELGRTNRKIRDVLELGPGSVVELDHIAGEPIDILVNDKLFAKGEVVVIDENFGVRITDILSIEERIEALK